DTRARVVLRALSGDEHPADPGEDEAEDRHYDQQLDQRVAVGRREPLLHPASRRPAAGAGSGSGSGSGSDICSTCSATACTFSSRSSATRKSWRLLDASAAASLSIAPSITLEISACWQVCIPK